MYISTTASNILSICPKIQLSEEDTDPFYVSIYHLDGQKHKYGMYLLFYERSFTTNVQLV